MTPAYADESVTLHHGDSIELLRSDVLGYDYRLGYAEPLFPDASIDAVVTDPPYGIAFMGKAWDQPGQYGSRLASTGLNHARGAKDAALEAGKYDLSPSAMRNFQAWCTEWATECLRVLKPGGHMLAFGSSRTSHRLATAVEDAGFEIRDSIAWLFGSGFPKSLDVSKAIDKLDATEERLGRARQFQAWLAPLMTAQRVDELTGTAMGHHLTTHPTQPSVATAQLFDLLRPHLPEVPARIEQLVSDRTVESANFAQRPRADHGSRPGMAESWTDGRGWNGSASRGGSGVTADAQQWEGWGTALKPAFEPIVVGRKPLAGTVAANVLTHGTGALNIDGCRTAHASAADLAESQGKNRHADFGTESGGNEVYGDYSMVERVNYDGSAGRWPTNMVLRHSPDCTPDSACVTDGRCPVQQLGSVARFFPAFYYEAKASKDERPHYWRHGCDCDHHDPMPAGGTCHACGAPGERVAHPTVKPLDLMRWLVRLVTSRGGTVLDLFAGSGTTGEACVVEGFNCVLLEREADHIPLIVSRLSKPIQVGLDLGALG